MMVPVTDFAGRVDVEENRSSIRKKKYGLAGRNLRKLIESFNKDAFASYSDWRLPTRKELKSLYEEDKNSSLEILLD